MSGVCIFYDFRVLFLNPEQKMDLFKVHSYIKKIFVVLLIFGTVYSFLELFFSKNIFILYISNSSIFYKYDI